MDRRDKPTLHIGATLLLLASIAAITAPAHADAKTVLVIAAHPDDEVFLAAGRAREALGAGDVIKVVIVTNGDIDGTARGLERQWESVLSAFAIGLTEDDVIFFGYPDGDTRTIYDSASGTTVFTSRATGQTATYGSYGLGGMDYHRYLYGVPGPYSRDTMLGDFRALLENFRPDEIYTHTHFDAHGDHEATALFVNEALVTLARSGSTVAPKVYQSIIWMWHSSGVAHPWPQITPSGWTPAVPFLPWSSPCVPGDCLDRTQLEWSRVRRFPQPPEMTRADPATNMKALAIPGGPATAGGWFGSWVRKEEFFWLTDYATNLAPIAAVTASSEDAGGGRGVARAIDGIVAGLPESRDIAKEWVAPGQLAGAWIELRWPDPVRIAQVNLWDRASTAENVRSGSLTFSDGSSVPVGALPANGRVAPVTFGPKTVHWLRFTVDEAQGTATGLAEVQVLGVPASATGNVAPHLLSGPVPAAETIAASQTTTLSVAAHDLDGDALQYEWSAEGGFVQGSGATAVFTPPSVPSETWFTITVRVRDGRGGLATNSTFVRVTPAPTSSVAVSPSTLFGGDPAQGIVTLGVAAPPGGVVVPLSSDTALVTVPPEVIVPAGAVTAGFPVSTRAVASPTSALVAADFSGGTRVSSMTLLPRSVSGLSVTPGNVLGGTSAQGTITLPAAAGPEGAVVALDSSDPSIAAVPASVTVPAGSTSATFPVATAAVPSGRTVTLSATFGTTATASLTVGPLAVYTVALDPDAVVGGATSRATVLLNGTAASGAVVAVSSSDPALAAVPSSVAVPAGSDTAGFVVATNAVFAPATVGITASLFGSSVTAPLTVGPDLPPPPNPNLLVNPDQIGASPWQLLGQPNITVTLNYAPAPDGTQHATRVVTTPSGHALRQMVSVRAETTYTFSFFARNNGGTAAAYSVYDLSAGREIVPPTSYFSQLSGADYTRVRVTFTTPTGCTSIGVYPVRDSGARVDALLWGAKLEVGPNMTAYASLASDSLAVSPTSVIAGSTAQGTVTLASAAPAGGTAVPLSSSDPSVAGVPASVTVPAGATSAAFAVATASVSSPTTVTIFATFTSGVQSRSLTVTPLTVSSLVLQPSAVVGGADVQATATIGVLAGAQGVVLDILTSDPDHTFGPTNVTVPAGSASTTFTVQTAPVPAGTTVTLYAQAGSSSASAALRLDPPTPTAVTLSPPSVLGGSTSQGTVTLSGAAPPGGITVALSSSEAAASVPASVTVAAGSTSATFAVSTTAVSVTTTATIGASAGGVSRTAGLVIAPPGLASLSLSPGVVVGGQPSTGTVTFGTPAPAGGLVVALASSDPAAIVPATVTVPAGATAATFSVTTTPVVAGASATITATQGAQSRSASLTISAPSLVSLTLAPDAIVGGQSSTGTVLLDGAAPAGGVSVAVASDSVAATVPATVVVPSGGTTASFTVPTSIVGTSTTVTITARVGATSRAAALTVDPIPTTANPNLLSSGERIGAAPWYTVGAISATVDQALAPDGTQHATRAVVTSYSGHGIAQLVTVTPGTTYTFSFFARNNGGPSAAYSVFDFDHFANVVAPTEYVSLIDGATFTRVSVTFTVPPGCATVGVYPVRDSAGLVDVFLWGAKLEVGTVATGYEGLSSDSLSLSPASVPSGATAQGSVHLGSTAPVGGTTVPLSSSNPGVASVPESVTILAGATGATFTITAGVVSATSTTTITASLPQGDRTATLTVTPAPLVELAGLTLSPSSVVGGASATGTVLLTGAAPSGGVAVAIASSDSAAVVPASVTVPAGAASATFTTVTSSVTSSVTATISAAVGASLRSATLTIDPAPSGTTNPNLLSSPEQIGASPWQTLGAITVTQNQAVAPDGTQHATRAVVAAGAGHALRQFASLTPGTTYTFSFFARNNGGSSASYSVFNSTNFANIVPPTSYLSRINGSTFTRVSVTFTVPAGATDVFVYPLRDSGGAVDVLLWGAKLEVGTAATGYPY